MFVSDADFQVMTQRSMTGDDAGSTAGDAAVGATGSATVGVGVGFAATAAGATRVIVMLSLYDDMHHDLPVFIASESGPDLDDMWDRAFSIDHGKLLFEPAKPIQLQFFLLTSIGPQLAKNPSWIFVWGRSLGLFLSLYTAFRLFLGANV